MRRLVCCCLLAFVLCCRVAAEIIHEILEERTQVSVPCPQPAQVKVTWSREINGNRVDILTVDGDGDTRHNDPGKRFNSLADRFKSLHINRVIMSDSGRYFCNNEPAVDLTVIPSGTTRLSVAETSSVTLHCPPDVRSAVPTWSRDKGGKGNREQVQGPGRFNVSPEDKTLTVRDLQPGDSGLYYCDEKPAAYLNVTKVKTKTPTTTTPTTTTTTTTTPTTTTPTTKTPTPTTPTPTTTTPTTKTPTPTTTTTPTTTPTTTTPTTTPTTPTTTPTTTTTTTKTPTTTTPTTTTPTTTTPTTKTPTPTTTTPTTKTPTPTTKTPVKNKVVPPHLVFGIVVPLILLLLIVIVYFTWRRRCKRQGTEETDPVYDEIQDGLVYLPTDGVQSSAGPTAIYHLATFPDGSNQNDPMYSTIPDLPHVAKKTGSPQLTDNTYSLLEKPKNNL